MLRGLAWQNQKRSDKKKYLINKIKKWLNLTKCKIFVMISSLLIFNIFVINSTKMK